jgi:hypothetical protein
MSSSGCAGNVVGEAHRDADGIPATLGRCSIARVVQQDAAHHGCGQPDKLGAVPPVHAPLVHQPQVCLVDERGRLQRVAAPFAAHVRSRNPAELLVDER